MKLVAKILSVLLLLVGAFIVVCTIWGNKLSEDHIISISFEVPASVDNVWERITDWNKFPEWRDNLKSVEAIPDSQGFPRWKEINRNGNEQRFMFTTMSKPHRTVIQMLNDNRAYKGRWTIGVFAEKDHSIVTVVEEGKIFNPILRVITTKILNRDATIYGYKKSLISSFQQ